MIGALLQYGTAVTSMLAALLVWHSYRRGRYAEYGVYLLGTATLISGAVLLDLASQFAATDYTNGYVWNHSADHLSLLYKVTGVYSGVTGSLLLWATIVGFIVYWYRRAGIDTDEKRFVGAIAIVVLVLLAGCAGAGGGPTVDSVDYPPGYDRSGVTNTSTAIETHAAALNEPYRITFQMEQIGDRGAVRTTGTIRAIPDDRRAIISVEQTVGGQTNTKNEYHTANRTYWQTVESGTFRYGSAKATDRSPIYADREEFHSMLGSIALNATDVRTTSESTAVRYRVEDVAPTRMHTEIENESGTVTVGTDGQIRSMNVTFDQYISGVHRDVEFTYTTNETNVTVERPSWTDKANEGS